KPSPKKPRKAHKSPPTPSDQRYDSASASNSPPLANQKIQRKDLHPSSPFLLVNSLSASLPQPLPAYVPPQVTAHASSSGSASAVPDPSILTKLPTVTTTSLPALTSPSFSSSRRNRHILHDLSADARSILRGLDGEGRWSASSLSRLFRRDRDRDRERSGSGSGNGSGSDNASSHRSASSSFSPSVGYSYASPPSVSASYPYERYRSHSTEPERVEHAPYTSTAFAVKSAFHTERGGRVLSNSNLNSNRDPDSASAAAETERSRFREKSGEKGKGKTHTWFHNLSSRFLHSSPGSASAHSATSSPTLGPHPSLATTMGTPTSTGMSLSMHAPSTPTTYSPTHPNPCTSTPPPPNSYPRSRVDGVLARVGSVSASVTRRRRRTILGGDEPVAVGPGLAAGSAAVIDSCFGEQIRDAQGHAYSPVYGLEHRDGHGNGNATGNGMVTGNANGNGHVEEGQTGKGKEKEKGEQGRETSAEDGQEMQVVDGQIATTVGDGDEDKDEDKDSDIEDIDETSGLQKVRPRYFQSSSSSSELETTGGLSANYLTEC
ncbi:hypothetical protein K491DRAFT_680853, partial [Lophiostoma macrostomum CBS 122681]